MIPEKFQASSKHLACTWLCLLFGVSSLVYGQGSPDPKRIGEILQLSDRYINRDIKDSVYFMDILELDMAYSDIKDTIDLANASRYLGAYYRTIFAYEKSEKYLLKGLELTRHSKQWDTLMEIYKELILVYRSLGDLDKLKSSIDSSMAVAKRHNLQTKMLIPIMEYALFYSFDKEEYQKAIPYGEQFLKKAEDLKKLNFSDKMFEYRVETEALIMKIELAKCYIKTGQKFNLALDYLDDSREFFEQYDDHEKLERIYEEYLNYSILMDDTAQLEEYFSMYVYHSKFNDESFLNRTSEIHQYLLSLMTLERDLEISTLENKKLLFEMRVFIGFFVLLLVIAAIYFFFSRRNDRIQKKLNKSLIAQNELLEAVNKEKSKFFSIISHELRTPIYAITGLTSVMNIDRINPQQIRAIKHSGNYLLLLVNNILKFTEFENPGNRLNLTKNHPFNLTEALENIVDTSLYFASQYNTHILLDLDWDCGYWVKGDSQKLTQILLNLVVNSIKYSQDESVQIKTQLTSVSDKYSTVLFKVIDNGVGIPEEFQQQIFEFVERGAIDQSPDNPFNLHGMGIGLFVVSKLVTEMESTIHVESEVNKGTTFFFELVLENTGPPSIDIGPADSVTASSANILVVDDNIINLLVAKKMVERLNYKCYTADDTQDVISIILDNDIHLVLMDLNMPHINGYDLSKKIKERIDIPIIAHTAVIEDELDWEFLKESGMQRYIIKPYTLEALRKILYNELNKTLSL